MKKIIAVAVAAAFATPIWAADVTLTGDIEMRYIQEDGEGMAAATNDGDIYVTATEELPNGLSVTAKVGIEDAQTNGGIGGDVELTIAGAFGELALGEIDSAVESVDELASPGDMLGTTGAGNPGNPGTASTQVARYTLPTLVEGLTLMASVGHEGLNSDQSTANEVQASSYAAKYSNSGLTVSMGQIEADDATFDTSYLGVAYSFGGITVGMDSSSDDGANNQDTVTTSVSYAVGSTSFYAEANETKPANGANTTDNIFGLLHNVGGGLSVRIESMTSDTANTDSTALGVIYAF